jgi:tRNA(Ile)-lysidine synthase
MARLGPFGPAPALAIAVSGGPDSLALALLARDWARDQAGSVLGLVVDHALRPASAAEARLTLARLAGQGIAARILTLHHLHPGPGLAARARAARHAALTRACAEAGILHLLLGHHRRDQAETWRMRTRAGSGPRGLAAMAGLVEHHHLRLLRPLLATAPGDLRALLAGQGIGWVEDPSNHNPATLRARLRAELDDPAGQGAEVAALAAAAAQQGMARTAQDLAHAALLASHVALHPAGWARLAPGPLPPAALAALLRCIAGQDHAPQSAAVAALAAAPRAATLGGARLVAAGRGAGWLVLREAAAMQLAIPATRGALWDRRFRLREGADPSLTLGALGPDAARFRRLRPDWPAALLHTLPALRRGETLVAVPALGLQPPETRFDLAFTPPSPLCGAPFLAL